MDIIKRIIYFWILNVLLYSFTWCVSEDTVDISYILPDGGNFTNGTVGWFIETENYGAVSSLSGYVILDCGPDDRAAIRMLPSFDPSSPGYISLDTIIHHELQLSVKIKGSPVGDSTHGNSTVNGTFVCWLRGGLAVEGSGVDNDSTYQNITIGPDTTIYSNVEWGRFTTWVWITYYFTLPHQDWFQIRDIMLSYKVYPQATYRTQIWIDKITLEAIRFDDF